MAGRNADDIGNQAGGWTIDWQGRSGAAIPGTTILQGIREVAPKAQITFSADASAPTTGSDVGVVVVGETPYAEGFGDVGGPELRLLHAAAGRAQVAHPATGRQGRGRQGLRRRSPSAWSCSSPAAPR